MAAKFFTGLPMDGPDPECVRGFGEQALAGVADRPQPSQDHSRTGSRPVLLGLPTTSRRTPKACDDSPLA